MSSPAPSASSSATPAHHKTAASLHYRMPAEWQPHAATWLSWPRPDGISFPDRFDEIPPLWAAMTAALSHGEIVHVNVADAAHEEAVRATLAATPDMATARVVLHHLPTDEPWC